MRVNNSPALSRRVALSALGSTALVVSACTDSTGGNLFSDRDQVARSRLDALAFDNADYLNGYTVARTNVNPGAKRLAFYWSATCAFSADAYDQKISQLAINDEVMKDLSITFIQVARNETDAKYFAAMRAYEDYSSITQLVLLENAVSGKIVPLGTIDQLARREGLRKTPDYRKEFAELSIKRTTNRIRTKFGVVGTPTIVLDGKMVNLT